MGEARGAADGSGAATGEGTGRRLAAPVLSEGHVSDEDRMVMVCDPVSGEVLAVPLSGAVAGLMRFARSLGPGSAACAAWERRALEMARGL